MMKNPLDNQDDLNPFIKGASGTFHFTMKRFLVPQRSILIFGEFRWRFSLKIQQPT